MRDPLICVILSFGIRWLFLWWNRLILDEKTNKMYFGTTGNEMWLHRFYYVLFTLIADCAHAGSLGVLSLFLVIEIGVTVQIFGIIYVKYVIYKCVISKILNSLGSEIFHILYTSARILILQTQTFFLNRSFRKLDRQVADLKTQFRLDGISHHSIYTVLHEEVGKEHPKYVQSAQLLDREEHPRARNHRQLVIEPLAYS